MRGLEIFRERFRRFEDSFILIGGAACDQWFADNRLEFRATKDLDMVLIVEILDRDFVAAMRAFIEEGGYEIRHPKPDGLAHFELGDQAGDPIRILSSAASTSAFLKRTARPILK